MARKLWWLPLTGFALISLASPWHAYGFDYKIYRFSLQTSTGDTAVITERGPGYIYHTQVRPIGQPQVLLTVTCPIIRDRVPHLGPTAPDERTPLDVGVWFQTFLRLERIDQTVTCTFFSLDETGTELFTSQQSTNPSIDHQALSWTVKAEQTAKDGTYSINCQLPTYVALLRYIAGEDKETDVGGF